MVCCWRYLLHWRSVAFVQETDTCVFILGCISVHFMVLLTPHELTSYVEFLPFLFCNCIVCLCFWFLLFQFPFPFFHLWSSQPVFTSVCSSIKKKEFIFTPARFKPSKCFLCSHNSFVIFDGAGIFVLMIFRHQIITAFYGVIVLCPHTSWTLPYTPKNRQG